jgi:hypothetical protein
MRSRAGSLTKHADRSRNPSAFYPMCLCACVHIHSCTTPVNYRACLALLAVLILIPSAFQATTSMHCIVILEVKIKFKG